MRQPNYNKYLYVAFIFIFFFLLTGRSYVFSSTLSDLRSQIDSGKSEIAKIEEEIRQYQNELNTLGKQSNTLAREVQIIDTTRKKLTSDISLTERNITTTTLNIDKLGIEIGNAANGIGDHKIFLAEALRSINEKDSENLVEIFLSGDEFSDIVDDAFKLGKIQEEVDSSLTDLKDTKIDLEDKQREQRLEKNRLQDLRSKLSDQKIIVDQNKAEKDFLLTRTKNEEATYRALLAQQLARKEQFEEELRKVEEQIRVIIDPESIPPAGAGILKWPLDTVRITQQFGKTADSGRLYTSGTHNGADFGIPSGSEVKSALSGTIVSYGNTDTVCRGASYGKWVLVEHDNGLSTLYAHLSLIRVEKGQRVGTREVIGYSGNTGYSTGPHLHLSLFASQGVEIGNLKSSVPGCGTYTLPLASGGFSSYLDPLAYL